MRSFAFSIWLSHALHLVRKQGCPSSPALSSSKGGSRQEIADIPRFAARHGLLTAQCLLLFNMRIRCQR